MSWLPSRRVLLFTVTALTASVLSTVPAGVATAAPAHPAPVLLAAPTVTPTTFAAGTAATVTGTQCTPTQFTRVYVSLTSNSGSVVTSTSVTPSPDGTWTVTVTPPFATAPGAYAISATCDRYGSQAAYRPRPVTVTASTAAPWTSQTPALPDVPNGSLVDADCIAAAAKEPVNGVGYCAAVGHVSKAGVNAPLVEVFDGSTWQVADISSPVAGDVFLFSVDCPTTNRCVAVGDIGTDGHHAFVAIMTGTTWTASVLDPPAGERESSIDAVSCPSATVCIATGSTGSLSEGSRFRPIAYQLKNTTWTQLNSPVAVSPTSTLSSISCINATTCVAVGNDTRTYPSTPVAQVFDGTFWHTSQLAPVPSESSPYLQDVSCATLSTCTAVGSTLGPDGVSRPLVETLTNTTWKLAPVAGDPAVGGSLRSVSCTSNKTCTAVGATGAYQDVSPNRPVAATLSGGRWTSAVVDLPAGAPVSALTGVSCPEIGVCVAVGDARNVPLAAVGTSSGWTQVDLPTSHGYAGGEFDAVACSGVNACTAGGWSYSPDLDHATPLVNRWNGTSWSAQSLPDVGDARISGVACPAANRCIAVGRVDVTANTSQPLVLLWAAGTWRKITIRLPRGGTGVLDAVSCTSTTSCLAVGQSSQYGGDPLAVSLTGTTWKVTPTPPVGALDRTTLGGVSCVAGAGCRVIGSGFDDDTFESAGIDLVWDGATFTPGPAVAPSAAVSCTGPTTCAAVGGFSDEPTAAQVLTGSAWTSEPLPDPSGFSANVDGVSCRGTLSCVAVGTLIARRTGAGTWTAEPGPGGHLELQGVACPSDTRCVAVGHSSWSPTIAVSPVR